MPTVVALRFPLGRYHATPWNRSVNEAAAEWPPSTWRLLRALYATWRWRASDLPEDLVLVTLARLAEPPSFRIPAFSKGHTRHYLPDIAFGTDKVLDPFIVMARGENVLIRWESDLGEDQRACAGELLGRLSYLGRAESLCDATLLPAGDGGPDDGWIRPGLSSDLGIAADGVLVPTTPLDIEALLATTTGVRRSARTLPAGSRLVPYVVESAALASSTPRARRRATPDVTAVLLSLNGPVRPALRKAVLVGDTLRRAALRKACDRDLRSSVLAGKIDGPDDQTIRLEGHRHAHYVALDLDGDRLVDAAVVWAPAGLPAGEQDALAGIRRLHARGLEPVRVAVLSVLSQAQVLQVLAAASAVTPSAIWESVTPFAPPRHQKRMAFHDFLFDAVQRELVARGQPSVRDIDMISGPWLEFDRRRPGPSKEWRAYGLRVTLDAPTSGPLLLGALSHFGLGRFQPGE